ncbi:MAG: DUF4912 domain-containing protein [Clostridia bacterium]|nr:DUF4912 domain-containing protein [Clostridia bacterium]
MQLLKSEYYELPAKYNQTVIRLLVQSPTRMFVYWEVSDETIKEFNKNNQNYSDCTAVLRVTNLTKNYSYNIPVSPFANNYYIDVEDSGCNYQVELGRISKKKFVNIYTSNIATVPSDHPASYDLSKDGVLFGNYLCIGNKKRLKIYGNKEQYSRFQNQNHTAFENRRNGSSENNFLGSSDNFIGSSGNSMCF